MSLTAIFELVPFLKKVVKQKFSGLQVIIALSICLAVFSLYNLHRDSIDTKIAVQQLQTNTVTTVQFQSMVNDISSVKSDVGEVKTDIKAIKTALYYNHFNISPYISKNTNTNEGNITGLQ